MIRTFRTSAPTATPKAERRTRHSTLSPDEEAHIREVRARLQSPRIWL